MRLIDADELFTTPYPRSRGNGKPLTSMWAYITYQITHAPTIDAVPVGVLDQVRWERDVAIAQLNDYGVSFGEKADCVRVTRCKDCKHNNESRAIGESGMWCDYWGTDPDPDDFCRWGERRSDA